jgi:hypothetical protein
MEVFRSKQAQARFTQGQSYLIAEAFAGAGSKNELMARLKSLMRDVGMAPNKFMDLLTISTVGSGIYLAYQEKAQEPGMTEEDGKKWAMDMLWMETEWSQQSSMISQKTDWQLSEGATGKLIGMFTSTVQQYLSRELRDVRRALATGTAKDRWQAVRTLFINHILMPTLFTFFGAMWKALLGQPPDEDEFKQWFAYMIMGPFSGWYLGGTIVAAAVETAMTGRRVYGNDAFIPASGMISDTKTAVLLLQGAATLDGEQVKKEAHRLLKSNVPLYRDFMKAWENYSE